MVISRSLIVFLLILAAPVAYADELSKALAEAAERCDGEGSDIFMQSREGQLIEAHARDQIAQAEQKDQSGNPHAAYKILGQVSFCISKQSSQRIYALGKRIYKELGDEAEKKGQLAEAFSWFEKDDSYRADADRVELKIAKAKPDDLQTVGGAFTYFKRRNIAGPLKTVQAMALQNAKQLLAGEDKQFASHLDQDSLKSLEHAGSWLEYAEASESRIANERAEKRGDTRATETSETFLQAAISYYDFAKKPEKAKSVRDRAKKLGDEAKGKGESELAVEYYQIAGLRDQASNLQKATESKQRKDEGKRQQKFKKDQDNLEKELGM